MLFRSKSQYRHFKIQSIDQSHDPAAIHEVVYRRLLSVMKSGDALPHLLLIDGGKPQLHFAMRALDRLGIVATDLDIVALAKREEELFMPHQSAPLLFPRTHKGLQLLQYIRDEAHRFAVRFQRQRRSKRFFDL